MGVSAVARMGLAGAVLCAGVVNAEDELHRYTERAWRSALDQLAAEPRWIALNINRLNEQGRRQHGTVELRVMRPIHNGQWALFELTVMRAALPWVDGTGYDLQLRDLLRAHAELCHPTFGAVADDFHAEATALELATRTDPETTIPRSRERLRGYSWVTLCPQGIAAQLGGPEAMRGTFTVVDELPSGALLLQATASLDDYREAGVARTFAALAPVLIPGCARRVANEDYLRIAFGVDAATFTSPPGGRRWRGA